MEILSEASKKSCEGDSEILDFKGVDEDEHHEALELQIFSFDEVRRGKLASSVLPLVASIAAGSPLSGFDVDNMRSDPDEMHWIEVPVRYRGGNRFIIRVAGDSMEPSMQVGDYLVCEYHRHRQLGKSVVIMANFSYLDTGEEAVKRISEDETDWIFSSDNPKYDDIRVSKNDIAGEFPILGTVLYHLTNQQEI